MASDGRALENLVRTVEEFFLPKGCKVEARKLVRGDEGAQLAELDILITGRLGTTEIRWLIECRDRPSEGRAPVAWIEQLGGRKQAHGFNQVTAVSTTGFSVGAAEVAARLRIETRSVSDAAIGDFATWLTFDLQVRNDLTELLDATVFPMVGESPERLEALKAKLASSTGPRDKLLRAVKTGQAVALSEAFLEVVVQTKQFADVVPDSPEKKNVSILAEYPTDDHFEIDTAAGGIRIKAIGFTGKVFAKAWLVPAEALKTYTRDASGDVISQSAVFPVDVSGAPAVSVEVHNLAESGETRLVVRKR